MNDAPRTASPGDLQPAGNSRLSLLEDLHRFASRRIAAKGRGEFTTLNIVFPEGSNREFGVFGPLL